MTVIAWDGTTLAADKQATLYGCPSTVTKVFRVPAGLLGLMGNESHARALLVWFQNDMQGEYPQPFGKDVEDQGHAVLITPQREIRKFVIGPHYAVQEDRRAAWGSGCDFATAAMYLGETARRAVEVACALQVNCGMGIDTLTLENP